MFSNDHGQGLSHVLLEGWISPADRLKNSGPESCHCCTTACEQDRTPVPIISCDHKYSPQDALLQGCKKCTTAYSSCKGCIFDEKMSQKNPTSEQPKTPQVSRSKITPEVSFHMLFFEVAEN